MTLKVKMPGGGWSTWGVDNGPGVGSVRAGGDWHLAWDDAPKVSGELKVKTGSGSWSHASWMCLPERVGPFTLWDLRAQVNWNDAPVNYRLLYVLHVTVTVPHAGIWGLTAPSWPSTPYGQNWKAFDGAAMTQQNFLSDGFYDPRPEEGVREVTTTGKATITLTARYCTIGVVWLTTPYSPPSSRPLALSDFDPPMAAATAGVASTQTFWVTDVSMVGGGDPGVDTGWTGDPYTLGYRLGVAKTLRFYPNAAGDGRAMPRVTGGGPLT